MKKIIVFSFLTLILLAGCETQNVSQNDTVEPGEEKIVIAATFYPLAEFAKHVGGDLVEVSQVIPSGAEPHEYEPTAKDITRIYSAGIFLVNGANLDTWAEKITEELEQKDVRVIVMSDHIKLLTSEEEDEDHDESEAREEADTHSHIGADPHFWLDPLNAVKEVELIRDALIELDPSNKSVYETNALAYMTQLGNLDEEYKTGLSDCARAEIITSHSAFGYLADRYGFTQYGISGISPQEEPGARKIAQLADMAKEKNIKYIFFETLVSPRLAETLADEAGAQTLLLHPIGGLTNEDVIAGKNYVTLMRENLESLKIALECR